MDLLVPRKLQPGDTIRVVSPSSTAVEMLSDAHGPIRDARFAELGLRITCGEHVTESDDFGSSAVESRIADLHAAFADPEVAGILTSIGGYNANQLLPYLDWELIRANPKVFCGNSDITAPQNAMLARSDLLTYSGPHWSAFGMRDDFAATLQWFRDCLFDEAEFLLHPAERWSDDSWFLDQDDRTLIPNEGWWVLQPGAASGRTVGGNLCTFNLLPGTDFMPSLAGTILLVEDDFESSVATFDRNLTSLLQQTDAGFRGVLIGRFQQRTGMTRKLLEQIVSTKRELANLPVIANVDFGHTAPLCTLPIGGVVDIDTASATIRIRRH